MQWTLIFISQDEGGCCPLLSALAMCLSYIPLSQLIQMLPSLIDIFASCSCQVSLLIPLSLYVTHFTAAAAGPNVALVSLINCIVSFNFTFAI